MTRARLLIVVIAVAAIGCLVIVLNEQYASGSVYAEYSSQRTDRMGTAALYEALAKVYPEVSRNDIPPASLTLKNSDVLMLGLSPSEFDPEFIDAVEALAKNGNRIVIALDGGAYVFDLGRINHNLGSKWQIAIGDSRAKDREDPRAAFHLEPARGSAWERGGAGISRQFGSGAIVLLGSSWTFTNAALRERRDIAALQSAIGNPARIVFDETHLGTVEQGTVMGLARRFRLQGVLAVALVCALLFIWQSSMPFPPERRAPAADTGLVAASAGEGLRNLLAHHIPAGRVMSACVAEWRRDRGRLVAPEKLVRIENIAAQHTHPVDQWREIRAELGLIRKKK